jgi:Domain of unknown function (DUF4326)
MGPRRVRITGDLYHQRVPEGAVKVTRPGRWGNPHPVGKACRTCGDGAVHDLDEALELFLRDVDRDAVRRELRGRDLACWCPIGQPCHADLLLRIANAEESGRPEEPSPARPEPPPLS